MGIFELATDEIRRLRSDSAIFLRNDSRGRIGEIKGTICAENMESESWGAMALLKC